MADYTILHVTPTIFSTTTAGQFGDVYKANMNTFTVAVKVIKRYSSQQVKDQFENEMSIMSQVSHNNIVRLHGIIREGEAMMAKIWEN